MNFSDDELDELEDQYQDIDPKLIQIQILMELSAIRQLLSGQGESESEDTGLYKCQSCGAKVSKDDRLQHGVQEHNAPELPPEDMGIFEKI